MVQVSVLPAHRGAVSATAEDHAMLKVLTALLGWAAGGTDWRSDFMWNNIGSEFAD